MPTVAERAAERGLRYSVTRNAPQVAMAEETIALLRDGEKMADQIFGPVKAKRGRGMDSQRIINVLAGIVLAFLGWWSNNIWQAVQTMQSQITTLNVELARNYVPRLELQSNFDRMNAKLDAIEKNTKDRR